jgi:hypothetical protein
MPTDRARVYRPYSVSSLQERLPRGPAASAQVTSRRYSALRKRCGAGWQKARRKMCFWVFAADDPLANLPPRAPKRCRGLFCALRQSGDGVCAKLNRLGQPREWRMSARIPPPLGPRGMGDPGSGTLWQWQFFKGGSSVWAQSIQFSVAATEPRNRSTEALADLESCKFGNLTRRNRD